MRLHARPEADESFAIALGERSAPAVERVRQLLRRLPFAPYVVRGRERRARATRSASATA